MSDRESKGLGKSLSYVLRHRPDEIGITLDRNGYVSVGELITRFNLRDKGRLTPELLQRIVTTSDKQRFAFSEDGTRIRANQGHSVAVELDYKAQLPPACLYHGTAAKNLGSIRKVGLDKRNRHHVHLSIDADTARTVGARHGVPMVLVIDAAAMSAAGHVFYLSANGVWLVDAVPAEFIAFSPG